MRASDRVYEELRGEIISWRLEPGTALAEVELAARLGVSRTPVREALSRLVAEGLARPLAGRGTVVAAIEPDDIDRLFEVREALDVQAARLAARRGDPTVFTALAERFRSVVLDAADEERGEYYALVAELDAAIDTAAANPVLEQSLRMLRSHLARVRRMSHSDDTRLLEAASEHRVIAEAIAAGDPEIAASATRIHLHHSHRSIRAHLAEREDPVSASADG